MCLVKTLHIQKIQTMSNVLIPTSGDFSKRMENSPYWEATIGTLLSKAGLVSVHFPSDITDDDKSQSVDLKVGTENDYWNQTLRDLEVKGVSIGFKDCKSYPFDMMWTWSQFSYLNKWPGTDHSVIDFIKISMKTGAVVWVPRGTPIEMGHESFDKTRGTFFKVVGVHKKYLKSFEDFILDVKNPYLS